MEGAAGSIYVDIPFRLYGKLKSGGLSTRLAPVTLRRVNDVPGLDRGAAALAYLQERLCNPDASEIIFVRWA
jgi:hypothetical protein